jgi:streptogramin lyase
VKGAFEAVCALAGTLVVAGPVAAAPSHLGSLFAIRVASGSLHWRRIPPTRTDGVYTGIALGSDGEIWVADSLHGLERIDESGTRTAFAMTFSRGGKKHQFLPAYIADGADGRFYATGCVDTPSACGFIAAVTTAGNVSVFPIPSGDSARFSDLALGPDGNVWFTEASHVAKVDTAGTITEYPYGTGEAANEMAGIAVGSDGKMWFTELERVAFASVDPQTGVVAEYPLQPQNIDCAISGMASVAGSLYAACQDGPFMGFVGMTTAGTATYYQLGYLLSNGSQEVAPGANSALWYAGPGMLASLDPSRLRVTIYLAPKGQSTLYASAAGADGKQWVLAADGTIYVVPKLTEKATR